MRNAAAFTMSISLTALSAITCEIAATGAAYALDKVDPYICPTMEKGSGTDCFLEAIPQTYTMCRHIKSIEVIEFGLAGAQEGVNGAKTESCIEKHKLSINRPYQAALHAARNSAETQSLRKLYDAWLESLAKLRPTATETDDEYKERVLQPYVDFTAQTTSIRALIDVPPPSVAKPAVKRPPKKSAPQG